MDQYWQQLIGSDRAQSATQIVELLRRIDTLNAQIASLKKQLNKTDEETPASSEG